MPALLSSPLDLEMVKDFGSYTLNPLACAMYSFPWGTGELERYAGPKAWQADILRTIGKHLQSKDRFTPLRLAVSSGHGIGKSALISMVLHWAMSTCEGCRSIVMANTGQQLDTKTWPEISKWFRLAINSHWWTVKAESITVADPSLAKNWRVDASTWSENNTAAAAGLHNEGKRIVVVMDESSEISPKVWEVINGALTDENTEIIWIAFGNPTVNTGSFRECFGSLKHRWMTKQIDARHVEGTNKALFDEWVADYGEDSDFVRVRVRGEFPRAGGNQFIPSDTVADARKRTLPVESYERHPVIITCDVARFGDDKAVIGKRQGLKYEILLKLRGQDAVTLAGRIEEKVREHKGRLVVIDGDGNGGPVVDIVKKNMVGYFEREEHRLVEFHGGNTPADPRMYFNRRSEVWGLMRDWLKAGADIPDDPELGTDLSSPEYGFSGKNQIQLEKKDDMKRRGLSSPDDGDCLAMSFAFNAAAKTHREKIEEELAATPDPVSNYLIQLREHTRQEKQSQGDNWWE